jgi:hypothetical protein
VFAHYVCGFTCNAMDLLVVPRSTLSLRVGFGFLVVRRLWKGR